MKTWAKVKTNPYGEPMSIRITAFASKKLQWQKGENLGFELSKSNLVLFPSEDGNLRARSTNPRSAEKALFVSCKSLLQNIHKNFFSLSLAPLHAEVEGGIFTIYFRELTELEIEKIRYAEQKTQVGIIARKNNKVKTSSVSLKLQEADRSAVVKLADRKAVSLSYAALLLLRKGAKAIAEEGEEAHCSMQECKDVNT